MDVEVTRYGSEKDGLGTNRTLFVLTIVTALALPMTIIPGIFGMNVGGVPFQSPGGFWATVSIVVSLSGIAAVVAFRSTRT